MRRVLWGIYGAFNNKRTDIDMVLDVLSTMPGFTGIKFFTMSQGTQIPKHPIHPWVFDKDKGIFLLRQGLSTEYKERLQEWAEKTLAHFDLQVVLFNRYHQRRWMKNQKFKKHPFRDNDIGLDWGGGAAQKNWGGQAKPLYDSITFPVQYHWRKWKDIDEHALKFEFGLVDEIGVALDEYVDETIRILAEAKKGRPGTLLIMGRNEERAEEEGDRSELAAKEKEVAQSYGLVHGKRRFFRVVNRDTDNFLPRLHPSITGTYGVRGQLGALHEVHLNSNADRAKYLSWGYNPNKTVFSSDGWDEKAEPFVAGNRKLYLAGDPFVDILFEEAIIPDPEPVHKIDLNIQKSAKIYRDIVK